MPKTIHITQQVVHWASQECFWQHSGEHSVARMIEGWYYASQRASNMITKEDILTMGEIIEPEKNKADKFREEWVAVVSGYEKDVKLDPAEVPEAIDKLIYNAPSVGEVTEDEATQWFKKYEDIHPFLDGNGRSGSIFYNWLRGSLVSPVHPPNLWDDYRRNLVGYPEPLDIDISEKPKKPEPKISPEMMSWLFSEGINDEGDSGSYRPGYGGKF